tara:strand:- start:4480 stop:5529 length:1050 start_codon:yes stop_codon:yes gene_type:complete
MENSFLQKTLYRIIRGRLRVVLGDLVLYVYEPDSSTVEESFEVYDDAYSKAYFDEVPLKSDLVEVLIENDLWTPLDDREADKIEKEIENKKIEAFQSFYDKKKLKTIKRIIRNMESDFIKLKSKKIQLDHTSCEGVAEFSRNMWIISKVTKFKDGSSYNWGKYTISSVMEYYNSSSIQAATYRAIARSEPWRSMWNNGNRHTGIFDKPSKDYTSQQNTLCSFAAMYDNVYESPERPNEKVLEDDDCLDGWFLIQKRKMEKDKKKKEAESLIKNPKIANSQEIFVMANNAEAAKNIYDMNDPISRGTINRRNAQIDNSEGQVKFTELQDVKQDMALQSRQATLSKVKGGR